MVGKTEDFNEWYNEVVELGGLVDKRYPIKGMNVWTPYGWKAMSLMDALIRREIEGIHYQEVTFPLLIPEDQLRKESEHIKGFEDSVFWVTHGGANPLDVRLALRPTSETAMYPIFALWVRSHADLPLRVYQIVNVFRYETKQTRAFLRMREIHFFEGHTCHATVESAEQQIRDDVGVMESLARAFCLPHLIHRRPDWDKFPGAHYSLGADTFVAEAGRALQVATIHQYRDNFARAYGIEYEGPDGQKHAVHQTTYGMSERLLGAVVALHGDDKGLVLPPAIAPLQAVVVPIPAKGRQAEVDAAAAQLAEELRPRFRVHLDRREDVRPGAKFYAWERKGVPLRVELGLQDMTKGVVTVARRDTGQREEVPRADVVDAVGRLLDAVQENLYARAQSNLRKNVVDIAALDEARDAMNRISWCGQESCGKIAEERTGRSLLGVPFPDETTEGQCVVCGGKAAARALLARTY